MDKISLMLDNLETTMLRIGRVGENLHTQVRVNCISIFHDYPNATTSLTVQPPNGEAYPAIIDREGVVIVWDVLDSDLTEVGNGQVQFTFTDDDEIIKTVIGSTQILPSIEPTGEAPTPIENWIDEANELLNEFGEIDQMTASAETVAAGVPADVEVSKVDGHLHLDFSIPRGQSGNETIDDTAGIGDTDKVWSADKDAKMFEGVQEDLTAGNALYLLSDRGDTDIAPYVFRKTGGAKNGYGREFLRKIVGGTVAWNQKSKNAFTTGYGTASCSISEITGGYKMEHTSENYMLLSRNYGQIMYPVNHVVLYIVTNLDVSHISGSGASIKASFYRSNSQTWQYELVNNKYCLFKNQQESFYGEGISGFNLSEGGYITFSNIQCFDLTQMFGSTIADAIYAMEQATAGSGVAWFRSLFPNSYYAYDAGNLQSVQAKEHKTYDEDDNLIATYPLDSSLTLRGIPKWDSTNGLYYDGDEYTPDGSVKRKYGIVDLGTLNWAYSSDKSMFYVKIPGMSEDSAVKVRCGKYYNGITNFTWSIASSCVDKSVNTTGANDYIYVKDSAYTDAATFKTAMSGVYLVYELATPTTETADPYHEIQICSRDGTEEFVDAGVTASTPTRDVSVPVGTETFYPVDIWHLIDELTALVLEN